jgi:hypothetical protein
MLRIATLVAVSMTLLGGANAGDGPERLRLEAGQPFPEIVLPALDDGRPMSIADFRGQKVVLHVFASW